MTTLTAPTTVKKQPIIVDSSVAINVGTSENIARFQAMAKKSPALKDATQEVDGTTITLTFKSEAAFVEGQAALNQADLSSPESLDVVNFSPSGLVLGRLA